MFIGRKNKATNFQECSAKADFWYIFLVSPDVLEVSDHEDHDESYLVARDICHKSYQVIKAKEVEIVKEVKGIDGLCRFACGDF